MDGEVFKICTEIAVSNPGSSVALYGSYSRGDHTLNSDVDILLVHSGKFERHRDGRVCVSVYSPAFITWLARTGSLFALHLKTEAKIITDPGGSLSSAIGQYRPPPSYEPIREELRKLYNVLDVTEAEYVSHSAWLNRVGLYIVRTLVFAKAAEAGLATFSIQRIATITGDASLWQLYQRKYRRDIPFSEFRTLREYLCRQFNAEPENAYRSIQSLILNEARNSDLVRGFGAKLVDSEDLPDPRLDYTLRSL